MALVKSEADIKQYINTDASFNFKTVLPYIELAEDDVKRVLGVEQYNELNDYYNGVNAGISELSDLLPYAQRPIIYFAFLKGLDKFNVSIGNNGIGVISNSNLAPASEKRVENLRASIANGGWDSLEYLLQFLEENIDDYPLWESSDAYAYQYEFLISSARKFDELYKIDRSRLTFLEWRPTMADVELLQMNPVVGVEFMDELKTQIKADNVSAANLKVLPHLQKALAYLTAAAVKEPSTGKSSTYGITMRDFSLEQKQQTLSKGEHYLRMVKTMLDAAPDDYPTYKASSVYIEDLENYQTYENDEDGHLGVFG